MTLVGGLNSNGEIREVEMVWGTLVPSGIILAVSIIVDGVEDMGL